MQLERPATAGARDASKGFAYRGLHLLGASGRTESGLNIRAGGSRAVVKSGVFSPPPHTASPTPNTHSRLKYVSEHGVFGLHVGLVVQCEAGVVGVVLRVDLRTRMEAQDVSPRTQSERHNHTTPARKPARLATLREYGAERHELRSLRRRAHRAPILPRA